jgi:hypothetical protein
MALVSTSHTLSYIQKIRYLTTIAYVIKAGYSHKKNYLRFCSIHHVQQYDLKGYAIRISFVTDCRGFSRLSVFQSP